MKTASTFLLELSKTRKRALLLPALALACIGFAPAAQAQFPRVESFKASSAAGFRVGGSAVLTSGGLDPATNGYLRLTDATNNQAGFAIDGTSFPTPSGFSISFEFFSYGATTTPGADGFSVFLVDADSVTSASFTSGASGGSLGYAQKTNSGTTNSDGVPHGYIGIGIDEFGNYSNPSEGRSGGRTTGPGIVDGRTPNAVAVRGPGNGSAVTDYQYLSGTGVLPFTLDVPSARAQNGSPNYRRAFIDAQPQPDQTYLITVRIQHGNQVYTAIDKLRVPKAPDNLRIGFAGSTGGNTNIHEIRNLAIVKGPFANDDLAGTIYNQPVTLSVISNDLFPGSQFQTNSVDLDITTAGVQTSYTEPGKGTFAVNPQGQVTFTPSGTFAGVLTLPYTVADILDTPTNPTRSNPGSITIIVEGADVATSVSGPTSANPGARVTYSVNTANIGTQGAVNVVPTMLLPAGLSNVVVSSGSYASGSGLVTFGTTASLAAGAAPVTNTVTFTAPASGTVTGTATYSTPPTIPDPVTANNAATISTVVTGVANAAGVCATPGNDGPGELTSATLPNTYYPGTASAAQGSNSITLGPATGSATIINAGDLLLVMQMQGAEINPGPGDNYGSGIANNGSGNLATNYSAGFYEYVTASNTVAATGGTLQLTTGLAHAYTHDDYSTAGAGGQKRFQVIRVPQYSSLAVAGTVTGTAWNGSTGGVLAVDVAGQTTFAADGTAVLSMTGKGFRGGGSAKYNGGTGYSTNDYANTSSTSLVGAHGTKGEGIVGTPRYVANNGAVLTTGVEGYNGGGVGRGAPGNAGGGGTDGNPTNNDRNTGGGGGANGGAGGNGGTYNFSKTNTSATGGIGGSVVGAASASRLTMGGGGGAGTTNAGTNANIPQSNGGNGGGIIIFRTGSVSNLGVLQANGSGGSAAANSGAAGTAASNGGGGGGAGGTVLIAVQNAGISNLTAQAIGGDGGRTDTGTSGVQFGGGGGGGGGNIYATGNLNAASSKAGGALGTSTDAGSATAANGATAGGASTASNNVTIPVELAAAGSCLPMLTVSLDTSTPNVTRAAGNTVNPAMYTLTISNTGGTANNVSTTVSLRANIFAFDPNYATSGTLTLADGTASTLSFTKPTTAVSTPAFGGFSIPAGATVRFTFRATIASTGEDNRWYQADAIVAYQDPTRTSAGGTVQPQQTYAGGGTVNGSNYSASTSTNEDVMITRPLPVELKRFEVAAVVLNAEVSWITASELQNDHFDVERSLDGRSFERISTVKGQGTTTRETSYRYTDAGAGRLSLKPIYYRLRQVDRDGTSSFSPVRMVRFVRGAQLAIALYPNPHTGHATLDLTALPSLPYHVEVLDLAGRKLNRFQLTGGLEHALDLNSLPLGSYLVRVQSAETVITLPMIRN